MKKILIWVSMYLLLIPNLSAVSLPAIISDHMVLQQNAEVSLWGWGKAREPLTIEVSWDTSFQYKTTIGKLGRWSTKIKTPSTKGPHTITFRGYNTIEVKDVLLGEVWLCSGQSNMEWSANSKIDGAEEAIKNANHPEIRLFTTPPRTADHPQDDCQGYWEICTPATMANFSAVGYFFGKSIQEKLNRPVGLIESAWGGTPAEIWTPADVIENDYVLKQAAKRLRDEPWGPQQPGLAFNGMIAPLIPYSLAGALWYQGETNTANATTYSHLLGSMVTAWRSAWGNNFPFYYVQIAPYKGYGIDNVTGAVVRYEQAKVQKQVANTGMVVVSDIGNLDDIHPKNKKDVGGRLAALALQKTYHMSNTNASAPGFNHFEATSDGALIYFDGAENGLISKGDLIPLFELQHSDGKWHPALSATIEGKDKIRVQSSGTGNIIHVRFAFKNDSVPPLFNIEGLPASCFTTENY